MNYHVVYSKDAKKSLMKMRERNPPDALRIYNWISTNLENCDNPRRMGKPLVDKYKGSWRYRIGNYRIIANICDNRLIILIIDFDKRSKVYQ